MAKFVHIAKTLERRIRHGDYRVRPFPSQAELVSEFNANPRTVSKALQELIRGGHLVRQPSGRAELPQERANRSLHIGMVAPAYPASVVLDWHRGVDALAAERGWSVKFVAYTHWDDAAIGEALRGLDGAFFAAIADSVPARLLAGIKASPCPVVVLEQDVSGYGIPCALLSNPSSIHRLLDHVRDCGRRRVDCLNVQPMNAIVRGRIESWQFWCAAHEEREGELVNEPVDAFGSAVEQAYRVTREAIRSGRLSGDALLGVTGLAAVGAMRALKDAGYVVGEDVAVCSADDGADLARHLDPTLTCLRGPRLEPYIRACLNWFAQGGGAWPGSLLMQPEQMPLDIGESTGMAAREGLYVEEAPSVAERL